ncbi:hypothetical protein J2S09_000875 [Bacillus fengqiuensis]|nr:hypothetical protein [Bacillus fengqiuensis]
MPNKDEYLSDTIKYSIWMTNTDDPQLEPNLKSEDIPNEKTANQSRQVKQQEENDR